MTDVERLVPLGGGGEPAGFGRIGEIIAVRPLRICQDLFADMGPLSPHRQERKEQENDQKYLFLHVAKLSNTLGNDGKKCCKLVSTTFHFLIFEP